jgi:hypothetical protein
MLVKRALFIVAVATLISGCGQYYPVNNNVQLNTSNSILLNSGTSNVTLTFTALGASAAQTVTVNQPPATGTTLYTATPSSGCTGVVTVAGTASATTSMGPTGSFTVTPVAVAASGVCTISITSSLPGSPGSIIVNTSGA